MLADLRKLVALERTVFPDPWSETQWRLELRAARGFVLVVEEAGEIAGAIAVRRLPNRGEVLNLAVHPWARRRGRGRRLLLEACKRLEREGETRVGLEVRPDNSAALALYERSGFRAIGRRPRYYQDGSDALVLEAPLPLPST
ncbi:MAG: ribosomal protein S18-alanine N-acetyltransferase [Thermoanaerobaculia bacterium]